MFEVIAPRFQSRNGGYTRSVKVGRRLGDNALLSIIELVGEGKAKKEKKKKAGEKKAKPEKKAAKAQPKAEKKQKAEKEAPKVEKAQAEEAKD